MKSSRMYLAVVISAILTSCGGAISEAGGEGGATPPPIHAGDEEALRLGEQLVPPSSSPAGGSPEQELAHYASAAGAAELVRHYEQKLRELGLEVVDRLEDGTTTSFVFRTPDGRQGGVDVVELSADETEVVISLGKP